MISSVREKILRINADKTLNRAEKTRKIQDILTGHLNVQKSPEIHLKPSNVDAPDSMSMERKNSMFGEITGIVHADPEKLNDCEFVAAGVKTVVLPANIPDDEFCIFSQELLRDSHSVGALVTSKTKSNQLEWNFLCQPNLNIDDKELKGVHLFDSDYLTKWVKNEGVQYIRCPLCRQGAKKHKEVEEHENETMQVLIERRSQSSRQNDQQMTFFVENLILQKAFAEKLNEMENPDSLRVHKEAIRQVCTNWMRRWSPNEFLPNLKAGVEKGMTTDNFEILQIVLDEIFKPDQDWTSSSLTEFFTIAAKHQAVDCIKVLINKKARHGKFAPALKEAIATANQVLVEIIIESMNEQQKETKEGYICSGFFQEVIKTNMLLTAQSIVENRWHKPSPEDLEYASAVNNDVYKYLANRNNCKAMNLDETENCVGLEDWNDEDMDFDEDDDGW